MRVDGWKLKLTQADTTHNRHVEITPVFVQLPWMHTIILKVQVSKYKAVIVCQPQPHEINATEKCLKEFIEERHDNDVYQLTNFEKVECITSVDSY